MLKVRTQTFLFPLLLALATAARPDDLASIRQALTTKYAVTTTTADKSDIVKAGSVIVLKKSNLVTVDVVNPNLFKNTYRNGRITQLIPPFLTNSSGRRTFVSGEKLWITDIAVNEKGVLITCYSDAIDNVRYSAPVHFPFEKHATPTVDQAVAQVAEVFAVDGSDDKKPAQQPTPQPAPQPAQPTPPPIAPPPPPPADPKTVSLGETAAQVIASVGQPSKILKPAGKQIFVYSDMKVTFINGKVSDVQ
jgi:hypothetical protein